MLWKKIKQDKWDESARVVQEGVTNKWHLNGDLKERREPVTQRGE